MPIVEPKQKLRAALRRARRAMSTTQAGLGKMLGASQRTVVRWEAGDAKPTVLQLQSLARLVARTNTALAVEVAAHAGDTLASLGIVDPQAAKAAPATRALSDADRIDLVLCKVADHAGVAPKSLRALLHVAFSRAAEVGLTLESAGRALAAGIEVAASSKAQP